MTAGVIIWLVIFAISAASFLLIAAVVTVRGFVDMRMLLGDGRNPEDKRDHDRNKSI